MSSQVIDWNDYEYAAGCVCGIIERDDLLKNKTDSVKADFKELYKINETGYAKTYKEKVQHLKVSYGSRFENGRKVGNRVSLLPPMKRFEFVIELCEFLRSIAYQIPMGAMYTKARLVSYGILDLAIYGLYRRLMHSWGEFDFKL